MGAAALLRAGRSHRQLPLSDGKTEGARHPYERGTGHLYIKNPGGERGYPRCAFMLARFIGVLRQPPPNQA